MQILTTPYVLPAVSGSAVVVNGHQLLSPPHIPLPHAPSTPSRDAGLPPPDIRFLHQISAHVGVAPAVQSSAFVNRGRAQRHVD